MWKDIIHRLEELGLSRKTIAAEAGCSLSLVRALANDQRGKRLDYRIGAALNDLLAREERRVRRESRKAA